MDNNTLDTLTNNLEADSFINLNIKPEDAVNVLFPDIKKLLDLSPEMRKQLLSKWKYYDKLILTMNEHSNNQRSYKLLSWEQSFVMTLLASIYN